MSEERKLDRANVIEENIIQYISKQLVGLNRQDYIDTLEEIIFVLKNYQQKAKNETRTQV